MNSTERREVARKARAEGKAVYYRNRAQSYRRDASAARYRGNEKAAVRLDGLARQDEATASKLCY
jgi:hypothetical protein